MLKADIVVGGFLGDEGKGKYIGLIGPQYDAVMRVNATTNAGHCVSDGEHTWVTRQLPSVFFPERTMLLLAPGALVNLVALAEEVEQRPDREQLANKVKVASSASLVLRPYIEKGQGFMSQLLGSTHQGMGPSAVARAARHALHVYDIAAAVRGGANEQQQVIDKIRVTCLETLGTEGMANISEPSQYFQTIFEENVQAYHRIQRVIGDFAIDYTHYLLSVLQAQSQRVLIEGCNGMLLDNLHGAHPHVTSTSTNIAAMMCGANLSPTDVARTVVVLAAYCTCLGKRPFPTEMFDADATHFYQHCNEVDVAEQHRRRIGWLDIPALRKSLAGCHGAVLHINKLDVLGGLPEIKICTHYRVHEQEFAMLPDDPYLYPQLIPQYQILPGWPRPTTVPQRYEELPPQAQNYLTTLNKLLPLPIVSVGVGPRNQDILQDLSR